LKTQDGHQRVVRHGHLPKREVMTGIGPVAIRQPRVRDREAAAGDPDRIRFSLSCPIGTGRSRPLASSRPPQPFAKLVLGVTFNDGIEVIAKPTDRQPTTAAA
jgi:hypothetical protein